MGYDKDHPAMTQHTKLLTDKHTQSGAKCHALYDASKRNAASSNKREGKDRCAPCYELDEQQSQIRRAPNPTDLVSGSEGVAPLQAGGHAGGQAYPHRGVCPQDLGLLCAQSPPLESVCSFLRSSLPCPSIFS